MKDLSRGTDLVGPDRLPQLSVGPLVAHYAAAPTDWVRRTDEGALHIDLASAPPARLSVARVERNDTVLLGGSLRDEDIGPTRAATEALRAALGRRLDTLGVSPRDAPSGPAQSPLVMDVRHGQAAFLPLGDRPRTKALVLLSTREEFPDRQTLCAAMESCLRDLFERDDAARFAEHLPWRDEPYTALRSRAQRQMDRFVRFLQEYGMARVRLRAAFVWMDTLARAIPDDDPQQAIARGYVRALGRIVRAAEAGQLPTDVAIGELGVVRTLGWAHVDFVSKLPLVPRADCEVGEHEDDTELRRGLDAVGGRERPSGRTTHVVLRHVTWLPRFYASGPRPLADRRFATTLTSRARFLAEALADGRLTGQRPTSEPDRARLLRALEQHLVVRAAMRVALGRTTDPLPELCAALEWLADPDRVARAAKRVVEGFLHGTPAEPPLEAALESLAAAFAEHAGRCSASGQTLDCTVTLDDDLFEPGETCPLRPERSEGAPAAGPPWAWMQRLRVHDGDVLPSQRFAIPVRVVIDPKVLAWRDAPAPRVATREVDDPLTVVLTHPQPLQPGSGLARLLGATLGPPGPAVVMTLPPFGPDQTRYRVEEGAEFGTLHAVAGAVLAGSEALRAVVERLDPAGRRPVRFVTVFDRSREDDDTHDAGLRAMSRALETSLVGRAVYAQGVCRDPALESAPRARYRQAGTRAALGQHGSITLARSSPEGQGSVGVVVLAGRDIDCVLARSGRPVEGGDGHDLLWGESYLARREADRVTLSARGRLGAVLKRDHDWPGAITEALGDLRDHGCSHVVMVTHRAFERSTWRTASRNRLYDGEVPLGLLAQQPVCEGMTLVSMLCDTLTAISPDPRLGTRPADARLLVADAQGLYDSELLGGALRPFVAVATHRTPSYQLEEAPNGRRRLGLRRRIHVYLERGGPETPWLAGPVRDQVHEALVGLHLLGAEGLTPSREGLRPVLGPVLLPHRVFHVGRRCDAGELLWRRDHQRLWVNLVALAATGRRFVKAPDHDP